MSIEQEEQQAQTMVKVFQTKFGGPNKDAPEVGNCYAACLATLTGKPIDFFPVMPPNVDETEENREAYDKAISDKLAEAGFVSVNLNLDADSRDLIRERKILTGFPYIMSGTSPRGDWLHAVIFQDGEMLHDPHPSGGGILNWRFQELLVLVKPWLVNSQAQKIAEQAKEIEKLNTQIRLMEYRYAEMGDLDYNEPDWLARLKSLSPDGKP